jgi:two-component system response regulator
MNERLILLVEDNPDDEELTWIAFRKSGIGHNLVVARDGAEALEYLLGSRLLTGETLPAVILLDLKLPKVDGLEVLRRLRTDERTRTLPVVVLSTSREEQDMVRSYSLGASSYIRKPVDFDRFIEVMQQIALYWLGINERPVLLNRPA